MGVEVHVKDSARFKTGWAFFAFDGETPATMIPTSASCYACHAAHAAVDTTFVQFYPDAGADRARPRARSAPPIWRRKRRRRPRNSARA